MNNEHDAPKDTMINYLKRVVVFFIVWSLSLSMNVYAQRVIVTGNQNNILIERLSFDVNGVEVIQSSPTDNVNPDPVDVAVTLKSVDLADGRRIFATTRRPTVTRLNPLLGSQTIGPGAVQIVRSDGQIISHRNPDFLANLEEIVSAPDLRSYWDINSQPSIPSGDKLADFMWADQVITSGFLLYTERNGNSPTAFVALRENGDPIPGTNIVEVRGFQWNTGIHHATNIPDQTQFLVLFSPMMFGSTEPIHGIRVLSINEPDGKLVFFVNSLFAASDFAFRVNSDTGENAVVNIFENDELNGFALNPIDAQLTVIEPFPANTLVLNPNGDVDVPPNTAPGTYTLVYQVRTGEGEVARATVTVEVIEYRPYAFDDNVTLDDSFGKVNAVNVIDNDQLNLLPTTLAELILTEVTNDTNGILTLNADGSVDVSAGVPSGTYTLVYQICDRANPGRCDQATVTVFVGETVITAVDDNFGVINTLRPGQVGNVLDNDLLNNTPVDRARVEVVLTDNAGITGVTLSADGVFSLPAGLPAGAYTFQYDLIETINPTNRDQGTITLELVNPEISAEDDQVTTNQNRAVNIAVLVNDDIEVGSLDPATLTVSESPTNGSVVVNADGTITYTPSENYTGNDQFTYQICDGTDGLVCDTAVVTITVRPILLDLAKTADVSTTQIGGMLSYTITLTNNSEFDLTEVIVTDELPSGLTFLSAMPQPASANTWTISRIPAGSSLTIVIEAMASAAGEVVNSAQVAVNVYSDEVTAPPVTIGRKEVNLSISKTSAGVEVYEGNEFDYQIVVSNGGTTEATQVLVTDNLPSGVVFVSFSSTGFQGSPTVNGNTITWTIPTLAPGSSQTFTIRVRAQQVGTITNTVGITVPDDQVLTTPGIQATDTNQIRAFFVPNVITPGRLDGKNDQFVINGIGRFASNKLTIFNRYGDHVFEQENYANTWRAEGLTGGSYYYVLNTVDSAGVEQVFKGWIQVIK
nr:DUF11 domain-containing protein [Cytophagales bacterium]